MSFFYAKTCHGDHNRSRGLQLHLLAHTYLRTTCTHLYALDFAWARIFIELRALALARKGSSTANVNV